MRVLLADEYGNILGEIRRNNILRVPNSSRYKDRVDVYTQSRYLHSRFRGPLTRKFRFDEENLRLTSGEGVAMGNECTLTSG